MLYRFVIQLLININSIFLIVIIDLLDSLIYPIQLSCKQLLHIHPGLNTDQSKNEHHTRVPISNNSAVYNLALTLL